MSHDSVTGGEGTDSSSLRRRVAELEEALRQSERLLQAIIDHVPGYIYVRDAEWRFTIASTATAEYAGGRDRIIGRHDTELYPPDVIAGWRHNDDRIVKTGVTIEAEESAPHADGTHTHRSIKFPIFDGEGRVCAVGGVSIDITAQKRAEERLIQRDNLLRSILAHTPIIIYSVDADAVLTFVEGTSMNALGLDHASVGRSIVELWHDRPPLLSQVRGALAGNAGNIAEELGDRLFEMWCLPVWDAVRNANGAIGISIDVTDRRRAELKQRMQAQVIDAQRVAIQELSTPLIPLTTDAFVIPLIGAIDSGRAQQFMETLLQGVSERRATLAIVDVTGVGTVDTKVAEVLIKAAQAVRLLGAQVIMTGIRPQIAHALVRLDISFEQIVLYGSLQDGISHALGMKRTGAHR